MQPSIILQIKNNIPQVVFMANKDNKKEITQSNENLEDLIMSLALELGLNDHNKNLNDLLELARESDDLFLNPFTEVGSSSNDFQLKKAIDSQLQSSKNMLSDFSDYQNLNSKVKAELEKNQNADIFASILETIYNILIAKTILHASELGIKEFYLDDDTNNTRLREKMAKELEELGAELFIVED